MKKTIIMILCLLFSFSIVTASSDLYIEVTTDQDINSIIVQNSDGTIDNTIYCNGQVCNTNVNGNMNIPEGQEFNYYKTENVKRTGLSFTDITYRLGRSFNDYILNKNTKSSGFELWSLLDAMFVSHKEFSSTFSNMLYLSDEVDKLKAENYLLKQHLGIVLNDEALECQTALFKAKRINQKVITENGWIADPKVFGNECIKVTGVQ